MGPAVLLWFDVEDYINEESDDALLALLQMLAAKGVRGTFKLVGEKVRALEARGRSDILNALRRQAIGYHTDLHSQHPTVSEYCEPQGFAAGAALFERREAGGLEDVRRLLPVPVSTYGQPGASWAAQAFRAQEMADSHLCRQHRHHRPGPGSLLVLRHPDRDPYPGHAAHGVE